jgi:putative addiction module killer protein
MVEIRQTEAYSQWFNNLRDRQARARIDVRIRRLSLGNPGDVKQVAFKLVFLVGADLCVRPGLRAHTQVRPYKYRVYFVQRGADISDPPRRW